MIPMLDTFIERVSILGIYQQEILVFTDWKDQFIGDVDAKITGVDKGGYEN